MLFKEKRFHTEAANVSIAATRKWIKQAAAGHNSPNLASLNSARQRFRLISLKDEFKGSGETIIKAQKEAAAAVDLLGVT
jgi:hypothetical protein